MTLAGEAVRVGQPAPSFTLHYYADGLKTLTLQNLKCQPSLISVVPSLDTSVCQIHTKKFNQELAGLGDRVHALTVSLDLPFAQGRFCGAEGRVVYAETVPEVTGEPNYEKALAALKGLL